MIRVRVTHYGVSWTIFLIFLASSSLGEEAFTEQENSCDSSTHQSSGLNYSDIPSSMLNSDCDIEEYMDWAPVHRSHNLEEYKMTFTNLVEGVRSRKVNASSVCFHHQHFLQCDPISQTCKCAEEGIGASYRYVQLGDECFVGKHGHCHPKRPNLVCLKGLSCKKVGVYSRSGCAKYLCSPSGTGPTAKFLHPLFGVPVALLIHIVFWMK